MHPRIPAVLAALALVFTAFTGFGAASAEDSPVLARIMKSGELRVGMSGDQPPLNVKNKAGQIIGLEADLAALLATAMGVKATIVEKPFPQLLPALKKGDVDIVMSGLTITIARNMQAAFVGPYFLSGKSILTSEKALASLDQKEEIQAAKPTLAALEGSTSQKFIENVLSDAKLMKIQNYDQGISAVIDGKADAMVADHPICVLSVLRNPQAKLASLAQPLTIEPIGMAIPPNDPLFLNLLQNYLGAVQAAGILEALQKKWLEDASWLAQLP